MLQKIKDAEVLLEEAIANLQSKERINPNARMSGEDGKSPGDIVDASEAALVDLKNLLQYFKENFLDENGKFIKVSFWKWIFDKSYRDKLNNAVDYFITKIKSIAARYR